MIREVADQARSGSVHRSNLRMVKKCEKLIEKSKFLDKRAETVMGKLQMEKRQLETDAPYELSSDDNEK